MNRKHIARIVFGAILAGLAGVALPGCDSNKSAPTEDSETPDRGQVKGRQASAGYEPTRVKEGGTLAGTVVWAAGDPGKWLTVPYAVEPQDKETCGRGGHVQGDRRKSQRLQLGDRGAGKKPGVRHTVVWLEVTRGEPLPSGGSATVVHQHCELVEHVFLIPGRHASLIVETKDGPIAHTATGVFYGPNQLQGHLFNALLSGGGRYNHTSGFPASEGRVHLTCGCHYWTSAIGILQQHPYYAVTDAQGRFEIRTRIWPGNYRVHFWHAGWTYQEERKNGKLLGLTFGSDAEWSRQVQIKRGGNDLGEVELKGN